MIRGIRSLHADTRGVSLTELLVGALIGALIMGVVATTIFTSEGVRLHADDRSQFAADLSITSLSFDRDGVMATAGATAKAQTASITCATVMDLGFLEGGATVRYRTTAGNLQRISGSGTRTMIRNVSGCTWQSVRDGAGRYTLVMTLALTGVSGETLAQSLRAAPEVVVIRRFHGDERGQSLAIVLALITVLFLMGTALAAHISVALKTTVANEAQAGDLHAADAGAELGMWWQRNGNLPAAVPTINVNGLSVTTTAVVTGTVPCPTPTPVEVTGFEHGAVSIAGLGIFSTLTGTGTTADAAVARTGNYSLKVTDPGAGANNVSLAFGAPSIAVVRIYVRLAALPAANVTELLKLDAAAGNDLILGYVAATQRLSLRFGGTAVVPAASVATAGTWYRIDLRLLANTNPRTATWQIDGVAQTPLTDVASAASTVTFRLGSTVAADAFTANYDDVLISATSGDYPIGAGTVVGLGPDGMGVSNTPASFRNDDGTVIDANTYTRLDDSPMTGLTDYVRQQTIGATNYVEVTFGNTGASCVVGVSALLSYHAAGTAADTGKTSIFDGATERIVLNGDMSVTPITYASVVVTPAAATWTPAAVNGLTGRVGYSSDVTPNPYWDALLLEVATGISIPGTVTVTSTAGSSTITTTYTDVGSAMPTLLSWTTTR